MTRGPIPKEANERQRRHAPAIETVELGSGSAGDLEHAPKISARQLRKLNAKTRKWWRGILEAPQASQFGVTDWRRLEMILLPLVDRFNVEEAKGPKADVGTLVKLSDAIARHEKEFGLTPESRLRLRWSLRPKVAAGSEAEGAKEPSKPREAKSDPRRLELVEGGKG